MYSCTHICDNREYGHPIEDFLPSSDAVGFCCHRTSELSCELPGVHSDLDDVVDKCQQGCQGEGGNEQRDETKLDHWDTDKRDASERQWEGNNTNSENSVSIHPSICPFLFPFLSLSLCLSL